uniref:Uncharacterized protein n=1 Tax=Anguilla anguilla TaxID=7936 RepID=A0A0E9S788_ANGAN
MQVHRVWGISPDLDTEGAQKGRGGREEAGMVQPPSYYGDILFQT